MNIKRMVMVFSVLCATMLTASVGLGVKAGGVFTLVTSSGTPQLDFLENRLSWQLGVQGTFGFSHHLAFCPELLLSHYRSQLVDDFEDVPFKWLFSQTELQLPLLIKWLPLKGKGGWRPFLLLGPMLQYHLSTRFSLVYENQQESFELDDRLSRLHYSLVFGTGLAVPLSASRHQLTLEARYCLGVTNQIADINDGTYHKSAAVFLVGYTL